MPNYQFPFPDYRQNEIDVRIASAQAEAVEYADGLTAADIEYTPSGALVSSDVQSAIDEQEAAIPDLSSGTYSPTCSAETNLDGPATASDAQYMQVGDVVTVSGEFTVDPTGAASTSFEMSVPISSLFEKNWNASGVAFTNESTETARIHAAGSSTVVVTWEAVDTNARTWSYTFTYRIIV